MYKGQSLHYMKLNFKKPEDKTGGEYSTKKDVTVGLENFMKIETIVRVHAVPC
jgi:hypothetical protein